MSRCVVLAERQEGEGDKRRACIDDKVNVNDELKKVYCEAKCRIRRQVVLINYAPTQNVGTFQACAEDFKWLTPIIAIAVRHLISRSDGKNLLGIGASAKAVPFLNEEDQWTSRSYRTQQVYRILHLLHISESQNNRSPPVPIKTEDLDHSNHVKRLRRNSRQILYSTSLELSIPDPVSSNDRHILCVQILSVEERHAMQVILRGAVRRSGLEVRADGAKGIVADHVVFGGLAVGHSHTHNWAAGLVDVVSRWDGAENRWTIEPTAVPELAERDLWRVGQSCCL